MITELNEAVDHNQTVISLTINGARHSLAVDPNETLANVLRGRLELTGTKLGCESGACGSCSVLVDGRLRNSCLALAALLDGSEVLTVEGLAPGDCTSRDSLHPVQRAFVDNNAIQCGYCTPGMVLAAVALLRDNPAPSDEAIREALSGNLCRCTGYTKIFAAVKQASSTGSAQVS